MDRRDFVKTLGLIGVSALPSASLNAEDVNEGKEFVGLLVDTTRCVGCQSCTEACAEANNLPEPDLDAIDEGKERNTTEKQWTLVNRFEVDGEEIFVKKQCMHCNQPACAAACPTSALLKTKEGPVIWREDKCMGCRFCMVSCPFEMPKFEYDSPIPKIQKCRMCFERLQGGDVPACAAECPEEAITFGNRRELIDEARSRIYTNPDDYVHQIYGEHEVGGTGYIYLASVPHEKLGMRADLGNTPYPEYTKTFLYSVPIVLTLWPAFLLAMNNATKRDGDQTEGEV
ncbi:MAG: 4Fe-4S dicluster domain-containing protein [Calditrichales bacterium]|nr:MAG: 4Fe-4S dicluster domain-containing protein [Calditrichales bacterium]